MYTRQADHSIPAPAAERDRTMQKWQIVLYVLAMVAVIVGVDVLIFRNHFWARLIVNVGIVLVFIGFYLRFVKGS